MKALKLCTVCILMMLVGCASATTDNKILYSVAGALVGGALASHALHLKGSEQIAAGTAGALTGAVLGANAGQKFEELDKLKRESKDK